MKTKGISKIVYMHNIMMMQLVIGSKGLNDTDARYNQCLTWHDNNTALTLTCRIGKSSSSVSFFHEKSKTNVSCTVVKNTLSCNGDDLPQYENSNGHQVNVMLHKLKYKNDLSGDWFCQTNNITLKTAVDLYQGTINDTVVKIRGTIVGGHNGKRKLKIECSSCRKPLGPVTEIWINDTSDTSIWVNASGTCINGENTICHPQQCNCSNFGNVFQILYEFPFIGTNISCSMPFKDEYREGIFYVAATATFLGTDFSANTTVPFDIIKQPILRQYDENGDGDDVNCKVEQTTLVLKQDKKNNEEKVPLICTIPVIIMCCTLVAMLILILTAYFCRNEILKRLRKHIKKLQKIEEKEKQSLTGKSSDKLAFTSAPKVEIELKDDTGALKTSTSTDGATRCFTETTCFNGSKELRVTPTSTAMTSKQPQRNTKTSMTDVQIHRDDQTNISSEDSNEQSQRKTNKNIIDVQIHRDDQSNISSEDSNEQSQRKTNKNISEDSHEHSKPMHTWNQEIILSSSSTTHNNTISKDDYNASNPKARGPEPNEEFEDDTEYDNLLENK